MRKHKLTLLVMALLVLAVLFAPLALPVMAQGRSVFGWVVADTLTVRNRAVVQDGGLTVSDDGLTVTDDNVVIASGFLDLGNASVITVTMNATITPGASYQPLASAGTVNTSSITAGSAGELLTLVNTTNTSIVFTDTGTLKLTGNLTLGQFDSVTLISDGTNWVQLATANN